MLAELEPLIPDGYPVYVLFDSWYASAKLIKWWRREGDLLVENWIPIDLIDIFQQLGVDLFERMRDVAAW